MNDPQFYGIIHNDLPTGESKNAKIIRKGAHLPARRVFKLRADPMGHLPIISLSQSSFEDADPDFVNRVWEGKLQPLTPTQK